MSTCRVCGHVDLDAAAVAAEALFSDTMIESLPGIVYFYDERGRFLRWNRQFAVVSGYSAEEIALMHPLDFFAGDDRRRVQQRIADVFENGHATVEAGFVGKDGRATPYFFTGRRVVVNGTACLVGMGIDITERKHTGDRLAESERKYRELVEHANSIILRWNADGHITFLNEFGQRFFGYSAAEILGRHVIGTIVPPIESNGRDLERLMERIRRDPLAFEQNVNENMRRNGERVWIAWTNRIGRDAHGEIADILSVGTDITEQHRAESALRASELRYRTTLGSILEGLSADRVRLAVSLSQRCRRHPEPAPERGAGRQDDDRGLAGHCRDRGVRHAPAIHGRACRAPRRDRLRVSRRQPGMV